MSPDRWSRVKALFDEAAEIPAEERDAWLEVACEGDAALREDVERLLAVSDDAQAFFDTFGRALDEDALATLPLPDRIGPWRVVREVGRGGMGQVLLAERDDGLFDQRVAIKRVHAGLAPSLMSRFHAERRILASLDHRGVARLIDGGVSDDGRPYLVMEYVEGQPITTYADRNRLSIDNRLGLMVQVCEAVAYAHRHLVIHRDIKPSNVLVTETEEGPRVKLLDFGIAKLIDAEVELTMTAPDGRVMTPEYAAPEQVRGEAVTTATDVYGLGVLLYELLTGSRPYRVESRVRQAIEEAILDAEPTEPSTAVTGASEAAEARSTDPMKLSRRLRGDLDQIVLKALRKEPERRYEGAAALAADVARHLQGMPVEARPESARYRIGRFVRRHRVGVAAAAVTLLAVLGGAGAAIWQGAEASRQRDRAEAEARTSEEVTAFVTSLFEEADPNKAGGDTLTVFDALARGAARARSELANEPGVQAAVLTTIGAAYREMGQLDTADSLLTDAVVVAGLDPVRRASALLELGTLRIGQGEYAAADSLYQEALQLRVDAFGPEHEAVASMYTALGVLRRYQGEYPEGEAFMLQAIETREALGRTETLEYAISVGDLGVLLTRQNRLEEAETRQRQALALQRQLEGDTSLVVANTHNNLGTVLHNQGRYDEAEQSYLQAIGLWRHILGEDHPNVAIGLSNIATMHVMADAYDRARPFYEESLDRFRSRYGEDHPEVAFTVSAMGALERLVGNLDQSADLSRRALATFRASLEPGHPYIGNAEHELARTLKLKDDPAAIRHFRRALAIYDSTLTPDNPRAYSARIELASLLLVDGEPGEARQLVDAALVHAEAAEDSTWIARGQAVRDEL